MHQDKLDLFGIRGPANALQTTPTEVIRELSAEFRLRPNDVECLTVKKGNSDLSLRKIYSPPKLTVYGTIHQLTAAGTAGPVEGGSTTAQGSTGGSRP